MGEPRGPLGSGWTDDQPDAGTLARTKHASPATAGHPGHRPRVAQAAPKKKTVWGSDVLAGFDFSNAVIWLNEESLAKLDRARRNGQYLNVADVTTLAHEFVHVWQNRGVLNDFADVARAGDPLEKKTKQQLSRIRAEKAAALVRKDTERVSEMTEKAYIEFRLKREREAEHAALTIAAELKNSKALKGFAKQDADTWLHNNRTSYVEGDRGIRAHYRKTRQKLDKAQAEPHAQPAAAVKKVAAEVTARPTTKQVMRLVNSYASIFPDREQSKTLHNLLGAMDRYDALIVVSMALPK